MITKLARHLQQMPNRPLSAREILLALIDTGDVQVGVDGQMVISFSPDAQIVDARCEREERCNNVGADKTYANHAACTSKLEGSTADDINLKDCDKGVDDAKLHECLAKIHDEDCGNPIDALSRLSACRTGAICI